MYTTEYKRLNYFISVHLILKKKHIILLTTYWHAYGNPSSVLYAEPPYGTQEVETGLATVRRYRPGLYAFCIESDTRMGRGSWIATRENYIKKREREINGD